MKIKRNTEMLHPILTNCTRKIQREIIDYHNIPIRLFETGRDHDRHEMMVNRGKTKNPISNHLFDLKNVPPLYASAVDYVFYDRKWSWNFRDSTIMAWYILFGNLVLDTCPELEWGGNNRKSVNYTHFQLKSIVIKNNYDSIPCVTP